MNEIHAILDIGNTKVKLALFQQDELILIQSYPSENLAYQQISSASALIISSVRNFHPPKNFPGTIIELNANTKIPFALNYESPNTLGADRIALAAAAIQRFPNTDCLVIDAGTCITYDLITNNQYQGGAIAPGLHMRMKAMNQFTGKLPLVDSELFAAKFPGKSTNESMKLGGTLGFQHEILGVTSSQLAQYPKLQVVLTGGDAKLFDKPANISIFADPNFLLKGLNFILKHNVQ